MADTKIVFVAFAIEDQRQRALLKGQSLHPRSPYEFIDMSVKEPYDTGWKDKVRTRIRRLQAGMTRLRGLSVAGRYGRR